MFTVIYYVALAVFLLLYIKVWRITSTRFKTMQEPSTLHDEFRLTLYLTAFVLLGLDGECKVVGLILEVLCGFRPITPSVLVYISWIIEITCLIICYRHWHLENKG